MLAVVSASQNIIPNENGKEGSKRKYTESSIKE